MRIKKNETPVAVMKQEALLCLLDKYEGFIRIFTDASKVVDGGVAAAFYVQDHPTATASEWKTPPRSTRLC